MTYRPSPPPEPTRKFPHWKRNRRAARRFKMTRQLALLGG